MKNTIRNIAVPLAIMTLGVFTIKDYLEDSRTKKFGIIKNGSYKLSKYSITEMENQREINIYQRNDDSVYGEIAITAIDERKDGVYEEIIVRLKGKDTSRSLNQIPSDLESILKEANFK